MKRILFNERGEAHIILAICTFIIFAFAILSIVTDNWSISQIDRKTTRIINELNLDIYTMLDVEYSAFETNLRIEDEAEAYNLFIKGLKPRFKLDDNLVPLSDSPFNGPIVINNFRVVDESEVPYSDGYGRLMEYPGIIAEITAPLKTPILGLTGNHKILITTEVYR